MKNKILNFISGNKWLCIIGVVVIILAIVLIANSCQEEGLFGGRGGGGEVLVESIVGIPTVDTATTIYTGTGILERVIVGIDVAGGQLQITDGVAGSVLITVSGDTNQGIYDIGAKFSTSLIATVTTQTAVFIIYTPK